MFVPWQCPNLTLLMTSPFTDQNADWSFIEIDETPCQLTGCVHTSQLKLDKPCHPQTSDEDFTISSVSWFVYFTSNNKYMPGCYGGQVFPVIIHMVFSEILSGMSPLVSRHLANAHLANGHLANGHLVKGHLANRHLANKCMGGHLANRQNVSFQ